MDPQAMVDYAYEIVDILVDDAEYCGILHEDMLKSMIVALQLLKATYPCPARMFVLAQEAEGELAMLLWPAGMPC